MEIRSVDTGAGTEQVIITCTASLIGADAGSIEVLKTLPFAMEVTEVRTVLTSKLVTAGATSLIRVTDGTNNIVADQSYALADAIGLEKAPALVAANVKISGAEKLVIITTAGGTPSTGGHALVVIKARRVE